MDRITLENEAFEGQNNAYVLADDGDDGSDALALVDTGIATPDTRAQLRSGLDDRGYAVDDIDAIVLTHWHSDHAALAGELQAESDATVFVHHDDAPLVRQDEAAVAAVDRRRRERFDEWGMPAAKRESLLGFQDEAETISGDPATVEAIADGDRLHVGGTTLEAVHAPGHAAGLCLFEFEAGGDREALVGDAILPVYTPNVGGADVRIERPLAKYLDTLRDIIDRDYDRVWPGHRDPIDEPAARARTIADHHRDRAGRVLEVLRNHGPADAWTVSAHLFGDLEGIHVMHGPGEAYAHLDHLQREGVVSFDADTGAYDLVRDEVDLETLVPVPE